MKKLSKSMLTLIIVLSLLFAMAITVFAAHYTTSGEFKSKFGSGKYGVTMTLTDDRATASLSISDYFGVVEEGGGAEISYAIFDSEGNLIHKDTQKVEGTSCSFTYNAKSIDPSFESMVCEFKYYGFSIDTHSLNVN